MNIFRSVSIRGIVAGNAVFFVGAFLISTFGFDISGYFSSLEFAMTNNQDVFAVMQQYFSNYNEKVSSTPGFATITFLIEALICVLAGYVSARIAQRAFLLNATLALLLPALLLLYTIGWASIAVSPYVFASYVFYALLGGYLRLIQVKGVRTMLWV